MWPRDDYRETTPFIYTSNFVTKKYENNYYRKHVAPEIRRWLLCADCYTWFCFHRTGQPRFQPRNCNGLSWMNMRKVLPILAQLHHRPIGNDTTGWIFVSLFRRIFDGNSDDKLSGCWCPNMVRRANAWLLKRAFAKNCVSPILSRHTLS